MKKFLVFLIFVIVLAGAGWYFFLRPDVPPDLPDISSHSSGFDFESTPSSRPSRPELEEPETFRAEESEETKPEPAPAFSGYYYSLLTDEERRLYATLLESVNRMDSVLEMDYVDTDTIWYAFVALLNDNPALFWVENGLSYTTHTRNDVPVRVEVYFTYNLPDLNEVSAAQSAIDGYKASFMEGVTSSMTEVDKTLYTYEYLIRNTEYVKGIANDQNIQSIFLDGKSVCTGYAKATQYLLQELGIPCIFVSGYAEGEGSHAWNMVQLGGNYYWLDTTWGDPIVTDGNIKDNLTYDYFLVTDSELRITHVADTEYALPACTATAYNYYNVTGRMLSSYDFDAVSQIITQDYAQGLSKSTFRFASAGEFRAAISHLVEQSAIFDVLREFGYNQYSYSVNEDLNIITINF